MNDNKEHSGAKAPAFGRGGMGGPGGPGRGMSMPVEKPKDFSASIKKLLAYCKKYVVAILVALAAAAGGTILQIIGPDRLKTLTNEIMKGLPHKMRFFFGANTLKDLYYMEEFGQIQKDYPQFTFIPCLAFPAPEDNWTGDTGFVTVALDNQVDTGEGKEAYLCGSPGMLDACIKVLKSKGFTDQTIFYDKF